MKQRVKEFADRKAGFGKADRFLYVKMAKRLQACQPNVGPSSYDHHEQYRKLNESPCQTVMHTLDIPREEQNNYIYVGQNLIYSPIDGRKQPKYDRRTKSLMRGTGGLLVHPSLRPGTQGHTVGARSLTKRTIQKFELMNAMTYDDRNDLQDNTMEQEDLDKNDTGLDA